MFGKSYTPELLAKMSGENNPRGMLGKTHTTESLAKMSAAKGGGIIYVYNSDKSSLVNSFPSARKAAEFFKVRHKTIKRYSLNGLIFKEQWILSTSLIS